MGFGLEEIAIIAFVAAVVSLGKPTYIKWIAIQRNLLGLGMILLMLVSMFYVFFRRVLSTKVNI